jgi:phage shock protein C
MNQPTSHSTDPAEPKRLYRIEKGRKIAGVCAGIGEYFNADPTLVRLLWVILTLAGGAGIILYIIAWIIIPLKEEM